ncbi:MAG: SDR family oxidoreductase [Candidatus Aminicenantales bacterium]|jgi:NAD(P)-dependent dehydrogenase (short-subunit alcohol dehydrogenase family)
METKTAVVTGASGGIGAAIARRLGAKGWNLVLAARRQKELELVASQAGTRALPVMTDVSRREDMERLFEEAVRAFGKVHVWINNAGRGVAKKVLELTEEDFDEIVAANLKSVFYGMQVVIPHFEQRGEGHLINISSFLGRVPLVTFRSVYNAAKAAVNVLTANLRMDLRLSHPGIHVSLVMPGTVKTDFARNALGGTPLMPPGGRSPMIPQTPEEVAEMVWALIQDPRAELYTNPASPEMVRRYYQNVGAFEDEMLNIKAG